VEFLQEVAKETPGEMPKVGRAYLQGLIEGTVNKTGEFQGGQELLNRWQALGPETKKVLFRNPMMIQDMDNFFRLAEMQARNPNKSGSGTQVTSVAHVTSSVGLVLLDPLSAFAVALTPYVVAKMLYSPRAARLLMTGMNVPLKNKGAATIAFNNIMTIVDKLEKKRPEEEGGEK
jgi:hypothetical protein